MPSRLAENRVRPRRWLFPMAVLALTPKCFLCVLGYASAGAAAGLGGREICGAPESVSAVWTTSLAVVGVTLATGSMLTRFHRRRGPSSTTGP